MSRHFEKSSRILILATLLVGLGLIPATAAADDNVSIQSPPNNSNVQSIQNKILVKFKYGNGYVKAFSGTDRTAPLGVADGNQIHEVTVNGVTHLECMLDVGAATRNNVTIVVYGAKVTGPPPNYNVLVDEASRTGINVAPN